MTAQMICDTLRKEKLVAIVRGIPAERAIDTVRAILLGGVRFIEFTLDQTSSETLRRSYNTLQMIREALGDEILLGAGTVLSPEQAENAILAGAEYLLSPHLDPAVVYATKSHGKVSIPGALTPTEVMSAYHAGADFVKLFPAGLFGPDYLKALRAPLSQVPFLVIGNISLHNLRSFLDSGAAGAGIGGELIDKKAIFAGEYERLTEIARAYTALAKG